MPVPPQSLTERRLSLVSSDNTRELETLRALCWRQANEIVALNDTVAVLRRGANQLAADNARVAGSRSGPE